MKAQRHDKQAFIFFPIFMLLLCCSAKLSAQRLTPEQFAEDLDFVKTELPQRHKNLFAKISEEEFNNSIESIKRKSKYLTEEAFEIELYKLMKEIGDEHTRLEPTYETAFPLTVDFFEEGIFVTDADPAYSNLLYKKLDGVENCKATQLVEKFKTIVKTDNQSYFDVYFQGFVNNPRILKGLGITQSEAGVNFVLDSKKYPVSAVEKNNFSPKGISKLLRNRENDNYWFGSVDNGKMLYFNYQECFEQEDKPFEAFNKEVWAYIEKERPQKLIIDLRNNSGGNSAILQPFLDQLKESYLNKKGLLYVLIGKSTFSSALMNAVDLKRNYQSILIGQPTSGNVNHYGETRGFQLPNSNLTIGYSTRYWETWKGYEGPLTPDVTIKYSITNFREHRDEAIDYVINER